MAANPRWELVQLGIEHRAGGRQIVGLPPPRRRVSALALGWFLFWMGRAW